VGAGLGAGAGGAVGVSAQEAITRHAASKALAATTEDKWNPPRSVGFTDGLGTDLMLARVLPERHVKLTNSQAMPLG
jgi:hypothetical protein